MNDYDLKHPISIMRNRYPQIMLPIKQNMSQTEQYKNAVRLGQPIPLESIDYCFLCSDKDYLYEETFTCGMISILFLYERQDFEYFVQKIAYRCEPNIIPKSMGAITINGLNNWEKVNKGKLRGDSKFLEDKENYQDSIIVLSQGFYSNLDLSYTQFSHNEWLELSLQIRKYHELTHYICRKKYFSLRNVLLDEIFADCMGLIMAIGRYDVSLAESFLGVDQQEYKKGMRLENYISDEEELKRLSKQVRQFIHVLKEITKQMTSNKTNFEAYIDGYYIEAVTQYEKIVQVNNIVSKS